MQFFTHIDFPSIVCFLFMPCNGSKFCLLKRSFLVPKVCDKYIYNIHIEWRYIDTQYWLYLNNTARVRKTPNPPKQMQMRSYKAQYSYSTSNLVMYALHAISMMLQGGLKPVWILICFIFCHFNMFLCFGISQKLPIPVPYFQGILDWE